MQFSQSILFLHTLPYSLHNFQHEFCKLNGAFNMTLRSKIMLAFFFFLLTAVLFTKRHFIFPIALSFPKTHLDNHRSLPTQKISCLMKQLFMEGHLHQVRYLFFLSLVPVNIVFFVVIVIIFLL